MATNWLSVSRRSSFTALAFKGPDVAACNGWRKSDGRYCNPPADGQQRVVAIALGGLIAEATRASEFWPIWLRSGVEIPGGPDKNQKRVRGFPHHVALRRSLPRLRRAIFCAADSCASHCCAADSSAAHSCAADLFAATFCPWVQGSKRRCARSARRYARSVARSMSALGRRWQPPFQSARGNRQGRRLSLPPLSAS